MKNNNSLTRDSQSMMYIKKSITSIKMKQILQNIQLINKKVTRKRRLEKGKLKKLMLYLRILRNKIMD
jgi:hypothetical protein